MATVAPTVTKINEQKAELEIKQQEIQEEREYSDWLETENTVLEEVATELYGEGRQLRKELSAMTRKDDVT